MFVYLIGSSDGYCKIGSAKNSASRLSQLDGTKLPFELTLLAEVEAGEAAYRIERRLQEKFKAKHVRGEWFLRISAKEFLSKAKHYVKMDVAPKRKPPKPDLYEATVWSKLSINQKGIYLRVLNNVPKDIAEEMNHYAFTKTDSEEQLHELLKLTYLGMTLNEKTFQAI